MEKRRTWNPGQGPEQGSLRAHPARTPPPPLPQGKGSSLTPPTASRRGRAQQAAHRTDPRLLSLSPTLGAGRKVCTLRG